MSCRKLIFTIFMIAIIPVLLTNGLRAQPAVSFEELLIASEIDPLRVEEARMLAARQNLPEVIHFEEENILIRVMAMEDGAPVYGVIRNPADPFSDGEAMFFEQIEARFDLSGADVRYYGDEPRRIPGRVPDREMLFEDELELLLIIDSWNKHVMAFDPETGDLLTMDFIPPTPGPLGTPQLATQAPWGNTTVSDQTRHVVYEFDQEGNYLGVFAPADSIDTSIMQNIRGHAYRENDNLIVTTSGGDVSNSVVEFDEDGEFVGRFIMGGTSPLNGPWSIWYRDTDILVTGVSDPSGIYRYNFDGSYIGQFAPVGNFPQQVVEMSNGNVAVANFSPAAESGIRIYSPTGDFITRLDGVTGNRGVWELGNGNFITTNSGGTHEIDGETGALVRTIVVTTSPRLVGRFTVVAENPQFAVEPDEIDFGDVMVTESETDSVLVTNNGDGQLFILLASSDHDDFTVTPQSAFINPGDTVAFSITFSPTSLGLISGNIIFSHNADTSPDTVAVSGTGLPVPGAPIIVVDPGELSADMLSYEKEVQTLTVENEGGEDLEFTVSVLGSLPDITGAGGAPESIGGPDGFGYHWIDSDHPEGPEFSWFEISDIGDEMTALTGTLDGNDVVDLPFQFPFYDTLHEKARVSVNGFLTFNYNDSRSHFNNRPIPNENGPNNMLGVFWDDLNMTATGKVYTYYDEDNNRFIVQWTDVAKNHDPGSFLTFQAILYADGTVVYQYDYVTGTLYENTVGIENYNGTDGLQVAFNEPYVKNQHALKFIYWASVDPIAGTIPPGESMEIDVTFDTFGLLTGMYTSEIIFRSNDPVDPVLYVPVTLDVTGYPITVLQPEELDFGEAFIDYEKSKPVLFHNAGTDVLEVTNITIDHADFSVDITAFNLDVDESQEIIVTFLPSSEGPVSALLTVDSNDPESPLTIPISGEGLIPPEIAVYPAAFEETMLQGTSLTRYLHIQNDGGSDLRFNILTRPEQTAAAAGIAEDASSRGGVTVKRTIIPASPVTDFSEEDSQNMRITASDRLQGGGSSSTPRLQGDVSFIDSLFYDSGDDEQDTWIGVPSPIIPTWLATKFVVEDGPFILTHIRNRYNTANAWGSDLPPGQVSLVIELYKGGELPEEGELLLVQEFDGNAPEGAFFLIELEEKQAFQEDDVFWIVKRYHVDITFPQGADEDLPVLTGIFYWWYAGAQAWQDLRWDLPGRAYKTRALHMGLPWITVETILDAVSKEAMMSIPVTFDAGDLDLGVHTAHIEISSNDPSTPTVIVPVEITVVDDLPLPGQVELLYPEDGESIEPDPDEIAVELGWKWAHPGVSNFAVEIAYDEDFTSTAVYDTTVADTGYIFTDIDSDATYWWRVKAKNATGWGPVSEAWSFHVIVTDVPDGEPEIPVAYELLQNFPNPFNPSTTIRYGLPERSSVTIGIYNTLGQRVATIVNTELEAGYHDVEWYSGRAASGMYFYRIEATSVDNPSNRFVETKRMILLK